MSVGEIDVGIFGSQSAAERSTTEGGMDNRAEFHGGSGVIPFATDAKKPIDLWAPSN